MNELLAPAGSKEALVAAISNGANAIYLGLNKIGARAYANNFTIEQLEEAVKYAHLRNVKIYVTMNTIVFDKELEEAFKQIDQIYAIGVDGVIIQDLAIFSYITKNYPKMEAHCSTQMGIDDLEGTLLLKKLGAKRVVLSREVPIKNMIDIRRKAKLPIEVFIHGALCVSYSGNCLMSGLIGYRSGNRGRCVGSCRKPYQLEDMTSKVLYPKQYVLSMKDLATIDYIKELKEIDSLKIEGRMKEPEYVANITRLYRKAIDNTLETSEAININKSFNRTFTKGYMFGEDKKDITNIEKPNNYGYFIGTIEKKTNLGYQIKLTQPLYQNDIIRISHQNEDVNLTVSRLYDKEDNLIKSATTSCYIKIEEKISINDKVYKTKDYQYTKMVFSTYPKEYKKIKMNVMVAGEAGENILLTIDCDGKEYYYTSDFILEKAIHKETDEQTFYQQFSRLNDTQYELNDLTYYLHGLFIPVSKINELRRNVIEYLNKERLVKREPLLPKPFSFRPLYYKEDMVQLAVYCETIDQLAAAKELNIPIIYTKDSTIRRNKNHYQEKNGELLIGGYGGIGYYQNTNEFITDYSLNVVNYLAVYQMHELGAKRVTLSYEMNQSQINDLIKDYYENIGGYPNLEMIVYGHAPLMFTNYCPLKVYGQCGMCKEHQYGLKDEYDTFPILSHADCTTTILNGKTLNLIDDLQKIKHIQVFRIQLSIESYEETKTILSRFKEKLSSMNPTTFFDSEEETRGHFNKEIRL